LIYWDNKLFPYLSASPEQAFMSADRLGDVEKRLRKLVQDSAIYSVALSLANSLGLITLLIFTRAFSPESFGRYSTSIAVVAIVSTLLFGWTEQATVRFSSDIDEEEVFQNLLSILTVLCAVFLFLAGIGYLLFRNRLGAFEIFFVPVVALIIAQGLFQPLLMYFRGLLKSKSVARFNLTSAFLRFGLSLILALVILDHIVGWIWGTAIAILTTVILILVTLDDVQVKPQIQKRVSGRMLAYGIPMIGFIIGEPFLTQTDRILLELLRNSAAVGIYSSNYILVDQGLRLAYYPVLRAMQPLVVNEWTGDNEEEIKEVISDFTRYYLLLGVPVMVLGAVMGRPLSSILLDGAYTEGYVIIPIVGAGVFLWGLADAGQRGLELKEATLTMSIGVILAISLNVLLNIPLITAYGYIGAAVATFLSAGTYAVYIKLVSGRYLKWDLPRKTVVNTAIGGIIMAVPAVFIYVSNMYTLPRALLASLAAVPIYLLVLYTLGEPREDEVELVNDYYKSVRSKLLN